MKAGDWPSNVAGSAEMECRIGYVPGETMAQIKKLVEETVRETAQRDPWLKEHRPIVEWFGWQTEPWYQDPEHPFVQTFKGALESTLGKRAPKSSAGPAVLTPVLPPTSTWSLPAPAPGRAASTASTNTWKFPRSSR